MAGRFNDFQGKRRVDIADILVGSSENTASAKGPKICPEKKDSK